MPLTEFINTFNLRKPDGAVYFNAVIEFNVNQRSERKESEVQIVNILDKDTVYFLSPEINSRELPDIFIEHINTFTCIPGSCLKIEGRTVQWEYIICIFPLKDQ